MTKRIIESLSDLTPNFFELSRSELYQAIKPTIDAANKRLKRQGSTLKLSTRGLDRGGLISLFNTALNVARAAATPVQSIAAVSTRSPRASKVRLQLPDEFLTMTRKELVNALQPTLDAANKRIKRLKELKQISPALRAVNESGREFKFKGKTRNEVLKEGARAINFMNMKTSTTRGANDFEKRFVAKLSNKVKPLGLTEKQREKLWDGFRKLEQESRVGLNLYGSDKLIARLADEVINEKIDFEARLDDILDELTANYENTMRAYKEQNPFDI